MLRSVRPDPSGKVQSQYLSSRSVPFSTMSECPGGKLRIPLNTVRWPTVPQKVKTWARPCSSRVAASGATARMALTSDAKSRWPPILA
jgi:hypothetical protein